MERNMLVLARKVGEKIILNDNIEIIVLDSNQNSVRIGINAPKNVTVYREELYKEIKSTNINSNSASTNSIKELHELLINQTKPNINSFMNSNFEKLTNKLNK